MVKRRTGDEYDVNMYDWGALLAVFFEVFLDCLADLGTKGALRIHGTYYTLLHLM